MEKSKAELMEIGKRLLDFKKVKPGDTILLNTRINGMCDRFLIVRGEPDNLELWAKIYLSGKVLGNHVSSEPQIGRIPMSDFARAMREGGVGFFPLFKVFPWLYSEERRKKVLEKPIGDVAYHLQLNLCTVPPLKETDRRKLLKAAALIIQLFTGDYFEFNEEEGKDQVTESPETAGRSEGPAAAPQDGH